MSLCFENIFTRLLTIQSTLNDPFFLPDGESHGARRGGFEPRSLSQRQKNALLDDPLMLSQLHFEVRSLS